MPENFEIERKFLISYPDMDFLRSCASETEIVQTYLQAEKGTSERVRKRGLNGKYKYTHTIKRRISDLRRVEDEREISLGDYEKLLERADTDRNVIYKSRFCLEYKNQLFEIDIFPFWADRAVMEIELEDENQAVEFPPEIVILCEISSDKRYTNSSMAKNIPMDKL